MSKVWFVTGSSRGLGRAIVEHALERGDQVVATARKPERLDDLVTRHGDRVKPIALDVTDAAQAARAVRDAVEAGLGRGQKQVAGTLDCLEDVPVVVELARRRAEGDLPGAADAQVAARVDDPARLVGAVELALARRAREQLEHARG